ncbi:MAG: 2-oxo-4-hydroxy-4-carboxy-5-ureidoimidazoline decarboxylase [Rubrobacteraceae bacterium]
MPEKITLKEVNGLNREEFVTRFGSLYEHSPWVAESASGERPFEDLSEMNAAFARAVWKAPPERRLALIKGHPDLAGKAAMAGNLTPESTREQASLGLNQLSREEFEAFTKLNGAYKAKFGFPMVIAVREHTKDSIMTNAVVRLQNSREEEVSRALEEITKIARYRLEETVEKGDQK